jgi:hypothetical protein
MAHGVRHRRAHADRGEFHDDFGKLEHDLGERLQPLEHGSGPIADHRRAERE